MKAVMLSIRPEWCEKIAQGKKTVEIRKSKPKLETPFKCYIYCTSGAPVLWKDGEKILKGSSNYEWLAHTPDMLNGKVIGEFVCDRIYCYASDYCGCRPSDPGDISTEEISRMSCLSPKQLYEYEHSAEPKENCIYLYGVYGWHISELVIYDTPRPLYEFFVKCNEICEDCDWWECVRANADEFYMDCTSPLSGYKPLKRPPQSWCYVEDEEDE